MGPVGGVEQTKARAASRSWALAAGLALAACGAAALVYVLFAASSKPEPQGYARFAEGSLHRLVVLDAPPPQPMTALRDSAGAETTLAAFRGKVVLVNLWATWCAPCIMEMPTLAALQRRYGGERFAVVAVSIDAASEWDKAEAMLARLGGGELVFLVDPTRAIAFAARAPGMPTTILYDRDGRELARVPGAAEWDSAEAGALIEAALAE